MAIFIDSTTMQNSRSTIRNLEFYPDGRTNVHDLIDEARPLYDCTCDCLKKDDYATRNRGGTLKIGAGGFMTPSMFISTTHEDAIFEPATRMRGYKVFTSNGVFKVPFDITILYVVVIGAGGTGGGGRYDYNKQNGWGVWENKTYAQPFSGGGWASTPVYKKVYVNPKQEIDVKIGAVGQNIGKIVSGAHGSPSSFGSLVSPGGTGGYSFSHIDKGRSALNISSVGVNDVPYRGTGGPGTQTLPAEAMQAFSGAGVQIGGFNDGLNTSTHSSGGQASVFGNGGKASLSKDGFAQGGIHIGGPGAGGGGRSHNQAAGNGGPGMVVVVW